MLEDKSVQCTVLKEMDINTVKPMKTLKSIHAIIANEYHLNEHRDKCRRTVDMFTEPGLAVPPSPPFGYSSFTLHGFSPGFCPPTDVFGFRRKHR